jgi:hypothetical protein
MKTPIADMVEKMLAESVPATAIVLAVRAMEESVTRNATSRDASRFVTLHSLSPGAIRARRYRQNRKQNQTSAKANDIAETAGETVTPSRDASRVAATIPCSLEEGFFPKDALQKEESKKEKKKEASARARGTRLTAEWQPNDADRQFALDHHLDPEKTRAEFVDFWIGVPGSRGTKLDWSATWRNRVRELAGRNGGRNVQRSNGHQHQRPGRPNNGDALIAGFTAALSERPESRLYRGDEAGRGDGPQGGADNSAEPFTIEAGPGDYRETH